MSWGSLWPRRYLLLLEELLYAIEVRDDYGRQPAQVEAEQVTKLLGTCVVIVIRKYKLVQKQLYLFELHKKDWVEKTHSPSCNLRILE